MAAFGIEELSGGKYKVIRFPYRWQMNGWALKKPKVRRAANDTQLDLHLKVKARRCAGAVILRDTRRCKDQGLLSDNERNGK